MVGTLEIRLVYARHAMQASDAHRGSEVLHKHL